MIPFLKNIAQEYVSHYTKDLGADLSEFAFIFPNKRSGTFFMRHLNVAMECDVMLSPEIMTVTDLVCLIANRIPDNRIDLLFTLYNIYIQTAKNAGINTTTDAYSFDAFRNWGDVVLSDFNDVEMYGVEASSLFKNVKDLKEIQSTYLTEEQQQVMNQYFGKADTKAHYERFWRNYNYTAKTDDNSTHRKTETKNKFMELWSTLLPLYTGLNDNLEKRGLTYTGHAYRQAFEKAQKMTPKDFPFKKAVFIGFNVLSKMEFGLFLTLKGLTTNIAGKDEPFADFVWDATGSVLSSKHYSNDALIPSAGRYMLRNLKQFPLPSWINLSSSQTDKMPDKLEIIASPSASAQAKIAKDIIESLSQRLSDTDFKKAKVGIVLPDENLLFPMLYSLPEGVKDVNLTMGYPMRMTSTMSLVAALRRLQMHKRFVAKDTLFSPDDIRSVLSHPFMHILLKSDTCALIKKELVKYRYGMTLSKLSAITPLAENIFYPFEQDTSPSQVIGYLSNLFTIIKDAIHTNLSTGLVKERLDNDHIDTYLNALQRLKDAIEEHNISMNYLTVFKLADRLIAGEKISFEGEPLQGLQIMGPLETRCLDFEYIIIPSMNERIFPRRLRSKTLIPANLRYAYGMNTSSYEESIFAYYFYRMISRAKEVYMIYDARTSGLNSGDVSRYALQLKHLYAPESLNQSEYSFTIKTSKPIDITIEKDDAIIEELRKYCDENSKNRFSASSLEPYCQCPIKFFYQSVMHIKAENEPTDYMDPITRGDIIHNVMLDLYIPDKAEQRHILTKPNHLDKTYLSNIIANDQDRLEQLIRKHINISYLNKQIKDANSALTGDALLTAKMLQKHIIKIIEHDIRYAPITLYGGEIKGITRIQLQCGETVNFTYAIDRLDRIETSEGDTLRIVDYKSGNSHIEAASIDDVFNGNYKSQHIFQLMLYANLYSAQTAKSKIWVKDKPIRCEIYSIPDISKSEKAQLPEIAKETITNHLLINEQFIAKLEDMMAEIFNPQIPFKQTNCKANCVLCNYKSICRR